MEGEFTVDLYLGLQIDLHHRLPFDSLSTSYNLFTLLSKAIGQTPFYSVYVDAVYFHGTRKARKGRSTEQLSRVTCTFPRTPKEATNVIPHSNWHSFLAYHSTRPWLAISKPYNERQLSLDPVVACENIHLIPRNRAHTRAEAKP